MDPDTSVPDRASALLDEILDLPAGDRAKALERACAMHPDQARRLRARFETLRALGLLDEEPPGVAMPDKLGEFELLERIGGGGMGVVYRARQAGLGRDIALKVIRPEFAFFDQSRARFRREAEMAARLDHPGIVPVYTVGQEGGVSFLAMQLVEGGTLSELLERLRGRAPASLTGADAGGAWRGPWTAVAAQIALQVAEALAHAHARGVVHRDIKPSNIMLAGGRRAMLVDFGLATGADTSRITRTGVQLGSLAYSSPEQANGKGVPDHRTDLFSLGAVLYEMLTLRGPFEAATSEQTLHLLMARDPPDPRKRNPAVAVDLAAIVMRALEKEPQHRYPDAAALAADLRAFLDYRPVAALRPSRLRRLRRWARREPLRAALLVIAGLATLGVAGLGGFLLASYPEIRAGRAQMRAQAVEHWLARGYLALASGERAAARRGFEAALRLAPGSREGRAGLALLDNDLRPLAELDEARASPAELFEAAVRIMFRGPRGDDAGARRARDLLLAAVLRGRHARALHYFLLAKAVGNLEAPEQARVVAAALRQHWPDSAFAHYWAGYALLGVDPEAAAQSLRTALRLEPDLAAAHADLGLALLRAGDLGAARAELRRAVTIEPANARAWIDLGIARERAGILDGALEALQRAAALAPRLPGAHYNLARLQALGGDVDRAITSYRRVLALEPLHPQALNNLGTLLYERGELDAAVATFRRLVGARPRWAQAHRGLGAALVRQGDVAAAVAAYRRAMEIEPGDEETKRYLRQLEAYLEGRKIHDDRRTGKRP